MVDYFNIQLPWQSKTLNWEREEIVVARSPTGMARVSVDRKGKELRFQVGDHICILITRHASGYRPNIRYYVNIHIRKLAVLRPKTMGLIGMILQTGLLCVHVEQYTLNEATSWMVVDNH